MIFFWTAIFVLPFQVFSSQCGESTIPYSLETLPTGQIVLGCARPTCFGWDATGSPLTTTASFYRIDQHPDGFLRKDPDFILPFDSSNPYVYSKQLSICESTFQSLECSSEDQWVGGVAPLLNVTNGPTAYQCCTFDGLKKSTDRGIAVVGAGQIVVGGEVYEDDKQYAFDYISNIEKKFNDKSVYYEVNVRRMPCLSAHDVDISIEEVRNSVVAIREINGLPPMAFADPVIETNPIILPVQDTVPLNQNAVPVPSQQPFLPQTYNSQQYYTSTEPMVYCFTGDTEVRVIDGYIKRLDELDINDWVETIGDKGVEYVPISHWIHREPEKIAQFRRFELDDGTVLKITDHHFIYKTPCHNKTKPVDMSKISEYAKNVRIGDCLYKYDLESNEISKTMVTNITFITSRGIFSPMTSSGTILVNNIYSSCFSEVDNYDLQNTYFSIFEKLAEFRSIPAIMSILDLILPIKNM